jgi:pimeloyl-ACP methyl ester carboxylesterase
MMYLPRRIPRRAFVDLRGIPHGVARWDGPQSTPIVLLHGWGDCAETFQFVIDAWSRDRCALALDWRGFGQSASQGRPYWFPDYLADLDAFLGAVSPDEPVVLVGHSMGGNIAALYAGIRPERVRRLVNLEGFGLPRTDVSEAPARYARWLQQLQMPPTFSTYESIEAFAQLLCRRNPRLEPARAWYVASYWTKPLASGGVTLRWDPYHKLVNPVLYRREEAQRIWGQIAAPGLLVVGDRSDLRDSLEADGTLAALAETFRTSRVEVVEEAGHMLHHDRPEIVARLIETFLDTP